MMDGARSLKHPRLVGKEPFGTLLQHTTNGFLLLARKQWSDLIVEKKILLTVRPLTTVPITPKWCPLLFATKQWLPVAR